MPLIAPGKKIGLGLGLTLQGKQTLSYSVNLHCCGTSNYKISLYADDILLYIQDSHHITLQFLMKHMKHE